MSEAAPARPAKRWSYDLAGEGADYPEWQGPPRETLLICTQQRSGSTLLGEALYFSGGLGCALEYFHAGFRPDMAERWGTPDLASYTAAVHRLRTDPSGVLGVKIFWEDIAALAEELAPGRFPGLAKAAPGEVAEQVYRDVHALIAPVLPNPRHVRLVREDSIAQAVSHSVARQRRRWRNIQDDDAAAHRREVEFRFAGIAMALSRIQQHDAHWTRYFAANGIAPIEVRYEPLAADLAGETNRLRVALGAAPAEVPPPRLRKQGDARSQELAEAFRARFREMTRSG